uniref:RNA polymerase II subunit B1 CTD phosphatase RPAP2 homolog n=1 Tax=Leptobrachium leishanense TaxID=445787 RepID=A0A8C5QZH8_9ANUR
MADSRKSKSKSPSAAKRSTGKSPVSDVNSEDTAKRRAALEIAVKRKIESEKKALQIVESLLEDDVTEDFLVDCTRFISPAQYKDVVEERSIIHSCGYPICKKRLGNVPKQKYWISTKSNKVYDITERKCFCCNFCFRASKYFEGQIPQSPIWTREEEGPPEIKLLKEGKSGRSGVEIKLSDKPIKPSDIEKVRLREEKHEYSSHDDSDNDSVAESEPAFVSSIITVDGVDFDPSETQEQKSDVPEKDKVESKEPCKSLEEVTERLSLCKLDDEPNESLVPPQKEVQDGSSETPPLVNSTKNGEIQISEVTQRAVSKRGAEHLRKILSKSSQYHSSQKSQSPTVAAKGHMLEALTQTLNEWKTEETLKYLYGSNYVVGSTLCKEEPESGKDSVEELDEDDLSLEASDLECASTNRNHLDESLPSHSDSKAVKPAPDYTELKEEAEMLNVRVREFFKGHYILPEEVNQDKTIEERTASSKDYAPWTPALPLVDSCSQQQIRKHIVLEKLKIVLPAILLPLQITYNDVSKELHNLVKTFQLLPTMSEHKDCQQYPGYTQFVSKLLEELPFKQDDLDVLIQRFTSRTLPLGTM